MSEVIDIASDTDLRNTFKQLDLAKNRIVGALLVKNVLPLTTENRVKSAIDKALEHSVTDDELSDMVKSLKRAMIDSSSRCGADADWDEQASHFVIRAASKVVTPKAQRDSVDPLWQIVQSCRMARSCSLIGSNDDSDNPESESQYQIVTEFLTNNS